MERKWVEKGPRQRVHTVEIRMNDDGEAMVFVRLSKLPGGSKELPSDHYCPATLEEKVRMGLLPSSALSK